MIREPETWHEDWCNFTPDEFRCSCCNRLEISSDIMDLLQKARNELGPLTITSAYRCPDHNSKVSSTGPSGPTTNTINNVGTSLGGTWSVSQAAQTQLTVYKSAGSYGGGGYWFIRIISST